MADNREVRIKIRGLKKSFTDKKHNTLQVLDGLSLDVYKNEFLVILGPGQCGKTVLLNLILGLDTPDEGTIEFSGGTPARTCSKAVIAPAPLPSHHLPQRQKNAPLYAGRFSC